MASQEIIASEHSIKTCVMRTLLGYLWEPHCTGGNNTYLSYLDEVFLEVNIRSSISKGRAFDAGDVGKIAVLLYLVGLHQP